MQSIGLGGSVESKDSSAMTTMEDDSPITKVAEDALDRSSFAENLAAALFPDGSDTECRVIGLIGKWGCGKTSIVNMTKEILKGELAKKENRGKALNIIDFNPWQYTGSDDLIKPFLNEVAYDLKCKGLKVRGLKRKIASYSRKLDYEPVRKYPRVCSMR